jgi:hypothetical protein
MSTNPATNYPNYLVQVDIPSNEQRLYSLPGTFSSPDVWIIFPLPPVQVFSIEKELIFIDYDNYFMAVWNNNWNLVLISSSFTNYFYANETLLVGLRYNGSATFIDIYVDLKIVHSAPLLTNVYPQGSGLLTNDNQIITCVTSVFFFFILKFYFIDNSFTICLEANIITGNYTVLFTLEGTTSIYTMFLDEDLLYVGGFISFDNLNGFGIFSMKNK